MVSKTNPEVKDQVPSAAKAIIRPVARRMALSLCRNLIGTFAVEALHDFKPVAMRKSGIANSTIYAARRHFEEFFDVEPEGWRVHPADVALIVDALGSRVDFRAPRLFDGSPDVTAEDLYGMFGVVQHG
jgi:hypothetical protein